MRPDGLRLPNTELRRYFTKTSAVGVFIVVLVFLCLVIQYSGPECCLGTLEINNKTMVIHKFTNSSHAGNVTHGGTYGHQKSSKGFMNQTLDDSNIFIDRHHMSPEREYHSKDYLRGKEIMDEKNRRTTAVPVSRPTEDPVQCQLLIKGDKEEIRRVRQKLSHEHVISPFYDYGILEKTKDCHDYRKSSGYYETPQSVEEEDFPLAFTIRMHEKVTMAEKLLLAIYHPQNVYCVHIDQKSTPIIHQAMASIVECLPNVFITTRNINFIYAGFSAVEADMICMEELLKSSVQWKYLLNMAGSEFPLKTNLELVRVLKVLNGTNDIEQMHWSPRYNYRINNSATVDLSLKLASPSDIPKLPYHRNITLMKGCSYNTFSREFIQWVLTDPLARDFINWTRDTIAPDETVWGTLNNLPQAPGGYHVEVTETSKTFLSREIIWLWSSAYCWEQCFVRGICILSSPDLSWLSKRWEFFANKFDLAHDHYAVECLAEWLRNRTANPDPDQFIRWDGVKRAPHVQIAQH